MKEYKAGLYIRLSKEDENRTTNSESIDNQIDMLKKYASDNDYEVFDTYIDDGFTGTNFNRPGFNKMLTDINNKKINMIIVKDLSRLGRDYILTGYYLEMFFPKNNIRFISVLDNIDSINNNDMMPFKSIMNDMYSKDNSKKIKAALRIKQQLGKWVGGCTPYGYMQDSNDKNHLVINSKESRVVKIIYRLFLNGYSINKIANYLYDKNIPTPLVSRNINKNTKYSMMGYWSSTTIRTILTNELYTGNLVQNRRCRINYKIRKLKNNDKSEWIIINNTHEPIITKDKFDIVQKMIKEKNIIRNNNKNEVLLSGLLKCFECNKKIIVQRNKNNMYIVCNSYKKYSKLNICSSHYNNYLRIESVVLNEVKKILSKVDINRIKKEIINKVDLYDKNKSIKNLELKYQQLYLDKLNNVISEELFNKISRSIINNIELLKEKEEINIDEIVNMNINRDLLHQLINRIEIHSDKTIDLYFTFKSIA